MQRRKLPTGRYIFRICVLAVFNRIFYRSIVRSMAVFLVFRAASFSRVIFCIRFISSDVWSGSMPKRFLKNISARCVSCSERLIASSVSFLRVHCKRFNFWRASCSSAVRLCRVSIFLACSSIDSARKFRRGISSLISLRCAISSDKFFSSEV